MTARQESPRLKPHEESSLDRASPSAVLYHLHRISRHFDHERWLGPRNVYRLKPVSAIGERGPSTGRDRPLQLGDYVAASGPLHLWDGWNYLSLAVKSHIMGATDAAKHLAYYAELRAAMSLLASQGIGVFNRRHCVIDGRGSIQYLSHHGTHVAVQLYLQHWAKSQSAAHVLGRILRMEGVSLDDWRLHLRHAGAWQPIGIELMQQIGLDLKRMSDDRNARNEASYRPSRIVPPRPRNVLSDAHFMVDMIALLEPGGSRGGFEILDRYLCRRLLERAFETGTGTRQIKRHPHYEAAIKSMVGNFIGYGIQRAMLEGFLMRDDASSDPPLIQEAARSVSNEDGDLHLQMLGRATILLRLATGVVRETLDNANIGIDSLGFWWQNVGILHGFWETPPSAIDRSDLWLDIDDGLVEVSRWMQKAQSSHHSLLMDCAQAILKSTSVERLALIGLTS